MCRRFTLLHYSSENGHTALTEYLLDVGADVDAITKMYHTPLILASKMGHISIVQILVGRQASIEHRSFSGCVLCVLKKKR